MAGSCLNHLSSDQGIRGLQQLSSEASPLQISGLDEWHTMCNLVRRSARIYRSVPRARCKGRGTIYFSRFSSLAIDEVVRVRTRSLRGWNEVKGSVKIVHGHQDKSNSNICAANLREDTTTPLKSPENSHPYRPRHY